MTIAVARGDIEDAKETYSSAFALLVLVVLLTTPLFASLSYLLPLWKLAGVDATRSFEIGNAVFLLSLTVLVSFFIGLSTSRLVATGKAHVAMVLTAVRPWLDLLATILTLGFSTRFDVLALGCIVSVLLSGIVTEITARRNQHSIRFARSRVHWSKSRSLIQLGLAFQAFPIGNAIVFQGTVMVVNHILGATEVAIFSSVRTLARSTNQVMELVHQIVWPEMSRLLGAQDYARAAKLHRLSVLLACIASWATVILLLGFGNAIFALWTGGELNLSDNVLLLFLLPVPFNSLWFTSSVVQMSCNMHQRLALIYLVGCLASFFIAVPLTIFIGVGGAGLSTLALDILLIPVVFTASLRITRDSLGQIAKSVTSFIKKQFSVLPFHNRLR
jgi:O-antigen/teichoic acid export membrane protein